MKKIIYSLLLAFLVNNSEAQLNLNLVVSANPPGTLSEWANRREVLSLIVFNTQGSAPRKALLKATLRTADGSVAGNTDLSRATILTFAAGNTILNANDVFAPDAMVFTGKFRTTLERTGKLPADNYLLCVQLVNPGDFLPITEERCRNFSIAAYQLPIPIMPLHQSVLDPMMAQTAITFRWTPLTPAGNLVPTYRVQVFEVLTGQTPMQAFRSNLPLLDKEVRATTQFIWQPQLDLGVCNNCADSIAPEKKFIWTIQTLDAQGRPVGDGNVNGDGRSEPIFFSIRALKRRSMPNP
jgi:hypothetical protein